MLHETRSIRPITKRFQKSSISCFAVAALVVITGLMSSQQAYTQPDSIETFSLTLDNVDIHSLIKTVSLQTGKNFIVDPRVKASVTVITSEPVNKDNLYELFLSVLAVHGYAAVPAGNFTKIVPLPTGVQSAVPVLSEQTGDDLITEVIHVENVPTRQLIESLRPLLPATATLSAEPHSNTVIITDSAANVARLKKLIRLLAD